VSATLTLDLGLGPTPATLGFCFDDLGSMSLLHVSFSGPDADLRRLHELVEKRWKTFLSLGVTDTFSKKVASAFYEALALDDGGCHAIVSWSETATGEMPGLSVSIVPGEPDWVLTEQNAKHGLLYRFDHEKRVQWKYHYCADPFAR
jgi:hypothetical protein